MTCIKTTERHPAASLRRLRHAGVPLRSEADQRIQRRNTPFRFSLRPHIISKQNQGERNSLPTGMPTGVPLFNRLLSGTTAALEYDRFSTGIPASSINDRFPTGISSASVQERPSSDNAVVTMRDRILSGTPGPVRERILSDVEASNPNDRISSSARPVPVCSRITSEASRCSRNSSGLDAVPVNSRSFTGNYAGPDLHRCQPGEEVNHYARRCPFGDQADHDVRRFPFGGQDDLAISWSQSSG